MTRASGESASAVQRLRFRLGRRLLATSSAGSDANGDPGGRSLARLDEQAYAELFASPFFDADLYCAENRDVAVHPRAAWAHYISYGWREGRRPSRYFDPTYYLAESADVAEEGIEPLKHWYTQGRHENRWPFDPFRCESVPLTSAATRLDRDARDRVVIAVPVFRSAQQLELLITSLRTTLEGCPPGTIVHFHDDASDDARVTQLLADVEGDRFRVTRSDANRGFTSSANFLVAANADRDVVLLNSDCIVFPGWLANLCRAAYSGERVASATAVTNNGTIASYPDWPAGGAVALSSAGEIAAQLVRAGVPAHGYPVIPSAVGHCMYLRRDALEDVGYFDETLFPRGYGEENDWSLRAQQRGWVHVLAADSYVMHEGGASFADTSPGLKSSGQIALEKKYPWYSAGISRWVAHSPVPIAYESVGFWHGAVGGVPRAVHVLHQFGGGTDRIVAQLIEHELADVDGVALVLRVGAGRVRISAARLTPAGVVEERVVEGDTADAVRLLDDLAPTSLGISLHDPQVLSLNDVAHLASSGRSVTFWVHDMRLVCLRDFMVLPDGTPCFGPEATRCERCLSLDDQPAAGGFVSHAARSRTLLGLCSSIVAPSRTTAKEISAHLGVEVSVAGADVPPADPLRRLAAERVVMSLGEVSAQDRLRVLLIGTMVPHKGSQLLSSVVESAYLDHPYLHFFLAGSWDDVISPPPLSLKVLGRYSSQDELQALAAGVDPQVYLIVSPAAETYSLVVTEMLGLRSPDDWLLVPDREIWHERLQGQCRVAYFDPHGGSAAVVSALADLSTQRTLSSPRDERNGGSS